MGIQASVAPDGSPLRTVVSSPEISLFPQATILWKRGNVTCRERIRLNHSGKKRSCACIEAVLHALSGRTVGGIGGILTATATGHYIAEEKMP